MFEEEFSAAISTEEELAGYHRRNDVKNAPQAAAKLKSRVIALSPFRKHNRQMDLDEGSLFVGISSSDYETEGDDANIRTSENRVDSNLLSTAASDVSVLIGSAGPMYGDISAMVVSIGSDSEGSDEHEW